VFHWGLIPVWAKDRKVGAKMINARAETLAEKPAYKGVFKKTRCIIPMDGFYEWKRDMETGEVTKAGKPVKQPFFIHTTTGEPLAVAGVWSTWRDKAQGPDAPWLHSCSVVTTSANETMSYVHNRMPVMLPESAWAQDPAVRLVIPHQPDERHHRSPASGLHRARQRGRIDRLPGEIRHGHPPASGGSTATSSPAASVAVSATCARLTAQSGRGGSSTPPGAARRCLTTSATVAGAASSSVTASAPNTSA
jgi:hypothetical protein